MKRKYTQDLWNLAITSISCLYCSARKDKDEQKTIRVKSKIKEEIVCADKTMLAVESAEKLQKLLKVIVRESEE